MKSNTFVNEAQQHKEGPVAKTIEQQTAKLPSDVFLWGALGAVGAAAFLQATSRKHESLFVGQWVAPLLLLGIYNKIVKVAGSDRTEESAPKSGIGNPISVTR